MAIPGTHAPPTHPPVLTAKVAKAPTSMTGALEVTIPAFGGERSLVRGWIPHEPLPVVGDDCLVTYDERGDPWVVAWLKATAASAAPGDLKPTARAAAPEGWLLCEGQAVLRTTYAALFAAIGTAYGEGDKSTTFNLPDGRDRALIGASGTRARGTKGGAATVTLTTAQMPAHSHKPTSPYEQFIVQKGAGGGVITFGGGTTDYASQTDTNTQGGGEAHENMPPYFVGNWLIKT